MIRIRADRLHLARGRSTRQETGNRSSATTPIFGNLTALPEEFAAMRSFIDNPRRANVEGDRADYLIGTMPSADRGRAHTVALTILGETGNDAAASACTNLLRSYRSVRCLLMAGIAAGVPDPRRPERHVRLGDIVVARGIAEYDSVRENDVEGKGIGNTGFYEGVEWFTVRGISDYGDRHVTPTWRSYASMAAAAYVRALLAVTPAAADSRLSLAKATHIQ
jgi:nucleoside phosphorylase